MSDNQKKQDQKPAASTDAGQAEVQEAFNVADEQGYFGVVADPTPNVNYTLQGQVKGAKTPETDAALADEAAALQRKLSRGEA